MRTIKFRGKVRTKSEWSDKKEIVYNNYWNYGDLQTGTHVYIDGYKWRTRVIPETVGQFTGLKDMNGKEIYEGDIVVYLSGYQTENGFAETSNQGQVKWDDENTGYYIFDGSFGDELYGGDGIIVIGNIHDNPELLEKEINYENY